MKASCLFYLWTLLFSVGSQGQEGAVLDITLHPAIQVTGEVGTTYLIESKSGLPGDFWLARAVVEMTRTRHEWFDPVPAKEHQRYYRAVTLTKPQVETIQNMVWIPPGSFMMGSPEDERGRWQQEGPQTQVTLTRGFWIGKYEVTQREYQDLMGENPSYFQPPGFPEDLNRPVEMVSWNDAVAYCEVLTDLERAAGRLAAGYEYRLPTEAQWEYACRAGTTTRFSFGDALQCSDEREFCIELDQYMWWSGNIGPLQPVGQKRPNPWGLYDMHGNASEWCLDRYGAYPGGSVSDPEGPSSGAHRVRRGCSWLIFALHCRSAVRFRSYPSDRYFVLGFRVALVEVP